MSDEHIFLHALHDRPDDDTTRLVYADWLDDQDDPQAHRRSLYLRLEHALAGLSEDDPGRLDLEQQLRDLAHGLPSDWTARVSKRRLENCSISFRFRCPKQWEQLTPTDDGATVRFCEACEKNVYYCDSIEEARSHAEREHCIAIDARVARSPDDLLVDPSSTVYTLGEPIPLMGVLEMPSMNLPIVPEVPPPTHRSWWRWLFGRS
jgi:uncharacterized protein (TIGR02996 family)